ncbi:MAG: head-tail connector protein [Rhodosalinus sp.]
MSFMLIEETPLDPAALPVEAFRAHLRLGTGFSQDDLQGPMLEATLRAAIAAIEARTGKILLARGFALILTAWRDPGGQPLPLAPVATVTEVALRDAAGEESPVEAARWWLQDDRHRPVLRSAGTALPAIPARGAGVVRFTAGFGADWAMMPADLRQAVLLLAAHYYEYRDAGSLGEAAMPAGVAGLLGPWRALRLGAGGAA